MEDNTKALIKEEKNYIFSEIKSSLQDIEAIIEKIQNKIERGVFEPNDIETLMLVRDNINTFAYKHKSEIKFFDLGRLIKTVDIAEEGQE